MTEDAVWQARVLREAGEPVERIAVTLGVGRATLYRALRDDDGGA
ncbi:helix-turn-helix domain-containing protein [Mycolicibacterium canariasense]|nr:helix-turn-helix domain-containing protein [Mycolicibacterium canariasense]MCV7210172.1 helix-turn-helix domain-containing protein [Mycolicibacterium canariasense]